ncbi:GerMN domain-containing protein [Moorella sp. Hama-1]|uniref:GerMN domain-containing protein n=1 Tax=Moorella sp. Hama-1 TaxID=2138101 RepID=UPI00137A8299|nr:GerMN domain-containing protein [Moorella sp. Hama-1]BCV23193.1 germination protein [Moorella sp. Hama-1]
MVAAPPGYWHRGRPRIVLLCFVLLLMVLVASGCGRKSPTPAGGSPGSNVGSNVPGPGEKPKETRPLLYDRELDRVLVYFLTRDGRYLVPVTVSFNPTREVAKVAVEKLLAGPQGDSLQPVFPEGVKLRDIYLLNDQQTVYVNLTREFLQIKDARQADLAVKALVLTMTNLTGVKEVQILVEGNKVPEVAGVKLDAPLARPGNVNSLLKDEGQKGVQVFFSDADAQYLVPVTVALPPGAGEDNLPRAAVLALLAGPPADSGLTRTIWPGTRLLDLKVEGNLATVDLSSQVIGYGGGSAAETALLKSLLFTLTQFSGLDRVQILIEGKKREYLPEGTAINKPLSKPEALNPLNH